MFISLNPDQQIVIFYWCPHKKNQKTLHKAETLALAFVQNMDDLLFDESIAKFLSFSHPFKPVEYSRGHLISLSPLPQQSQSIIPFGEAPR